MNLEDKKLALKKIIDNNMFDPFVLTVPFLDAFDKNKQDELFRRKFEGYYHNKKEIAHFFFYNLLEGNNKLSQSRTRMLVKYICSNTYDLEDLKYVDWNCEKEVLNVVKKCVENCSDIRKFKYNNYFINFMTKVLLKAIDLGCQSIIDAMFSKGCFLAQSIDYIDVIPANNVDEYLRFLNNSSRLFNKYQKEFKWDLEKISYNWLTVNNVDKILSYFTETDNNGNNFYYYMPDSYMFKFLKNPKAQELSYKRLALVDSLSSFRRLKKYVALDNLSDKETYEFIYLVSKHEKYHKRTFKQKLGKDLFNIYLSEEYSRYFIKRAIEENYSYFYNDTCLRVNYKAKFCKEYVREVFNYVYNRANSYNISSDNWSLLVHLMKLDSKYYSYLKEEDIADLVSKKSDRRTESFYKRYVEHKNVKVKALPKILNNSYQTSKLSKLTKSNFNAITKYQGRKLFEKMFGCKAKKLSRFVNQNLLLVDKVNPCFINLISLLLKDLKFNYDRVMTFAENNIELIKDRVVVDRSNYKIYKKLLVELSKHYSEDRILKLLLPEVETSAKFKRIHMYGIRTVDDIEKQFKILRRKDSLEHIPKKPKNLNELHDKLTLICRLVNSKDFVLPQEEIRKLQNEKVYNYRIDVPTSNQNLIEIGTYLDICVGDGYYADSILDGDIFILSLKQDNKYAICVEVRSNNYKIEQIKGKYNESVPDKITKRLQKVLDIQFKKIK